MVENNNASYAWLAVWALLRFRGDEDDADGVGLHRINAVAGQFIRLTSNAANDFEAALLTLVLIWLLACAKYYAKTAESSALSRKLIGRRFHPVILREPACLRLFPVSALFLALCHNDHLPTVSKGRSLRT
jgi:hypothetical protein